MRDSDFPWCETCFQVGMSEGRLESRKISLFSRGNIFCSSKTVLFTGQKIQNAEKTSFAICLIKMLKMHRFFAEKGYNFVKQYAYFIDY